LGAAAFKVHRDEILIEETRDRLEEQLHAFSKVCRDAGVACNVSYQQGELAKVIAESAQSCDLLMVGHGAGTAVGDGRSSPTPLHDIVRHCPRPTLVVPGHPVNDRSVLVAFDGSVQVARALEAFVASGWARDAEVHVLAVAETNEIARKHVDMATDYLRPHGLQVVAHVQATSTPPAEVILQTAQQTAAGLLVMGCYGRSLFREFLFGSVTRSVLNSATIPILLDH
jgi:nucleotide-binding universal stress UspA family protein